MHGTMRPSSAGRRSAIALGGMIFVIVVLAISQLACSMCGPLQRLAATETLSPTATTVPTHTPIPTLTPTHTAAPTIPPTPTHTAAPTRVPTRPPTHTPRPTNTVAPTSTPTPFGFIYEDEFTADAGVWAVTEDADSISEIDNDRLILTVKTARLIVWDSIDRDLRDVKFAVVAYPQPGVPGYDYGLVFRELDSQNFYLARVSVNGQVAIHKFVDGAGQVVVGWTNSAAIRSDRNILTVVCVGDQIDLYVNDTLVLTARDDSIAHGDIGLFVATGDTPGAQVQFDTFLAYQASAQDLVAATPTPQYTWADYLYFDLVKTRDEYTAIHGWYKTLASGGSVTCPSQDYTLHRPSYVIPQSLPALRGIYDRYLATIAIVDGAGGAIGPLDRIQLLCKEGKDIGQADINFDLGKLAEAGATFEALIAQVSALR